MKPVRVLSLMLLAAMACLDGSGARADDAVPAPPPPPPKGDRPPPDGQGYRPGPPRGGMMPGASGMYPRGGDREHMEAFNQLPEEERRRVREAFEKVWNKPEVIGARDRLMKANEEYREALHHALEEADSGVVKIIEKTKPPMPGGFPFIGRLPDANDPEFSKKVQARLRDDLQIWAKNEKREGPMGRFHERLASPAVRELVQQLESAQEPQRRLEAAGKLREAYVAAWRAEFGQPREGPPRREGSPPEKRERRDVAAPQDLEKK